METTELYCPQIAVAAGRYQFNRGIEIEVHSDKSSYFDWAKLKFTEQFQHKITLEKKDRAQIDIGYNGLMSKVFSGFVSKTYNTATRSDQVLLKDEMLLLEETDITDTFLDTTPQEIIRFVLMRAGVTKMQLSTNAYPRRKKIPIRSQTAVQAINTVNAAWGLKHKFYFADGTFYWGVTPPQEKVYTFEYGVNIIRLSRTNGVWMLETVAAPFVRHSNKIIVKHPKINGIVDVSKVKTITNDDGFIRTYLYF